MRGASFSVLTAAIVLIAPQAFAQNANAGATTTDANANTSATTGTGTDPSTNTPPTTTPAQPTASDEKITDVVEDKSRSYYFIGANYRMNLVPGFIINLFVDQGPGLTVTSSVGLSFDIRKDHFSIIPGVNFSEYGFDPVLFLQKGKDNTDPGNWGVVHSTLKAVYATVDLLWSVPLVKTGQADFEFGFGVGVGGVFGDLYNTWVSDNPGAGPGYKAPSGTQTLYMCQNVTSADSQANASPYNGCNVHNHTNATIGKVGNGASTGYTEPNWFSSTGGSVPAIFPWLSLPILGFRFKPIKQFEMRLQTGFSITGFFFNFAGYYGLESTKSTPH